MKRHGTAVAKIATAVQAGSLGKCLVYTEAEGYDRYPVLQAAQSVSSEFLRPCKAEQTWLPHRPTRAVML